MQRTEKLRLTLVIVAAVIVIVILMRPFWDAIEHRYNFTSNSKSVIKELRALNRLETSSFTIEKVIDAGTSGSQLQQLFFGDRLLLIAHGEVIAGFDLSKLEEDAIRINGKTIRITLPPPQILVSRLDPEQTRVYDRDQGFLTRGDKDLETEARTEAEQIIRQAACDGKILSEAEKNGRNQLTALFKTLGFETVILEVPRGQC